MSVHPVTLLLFVITLVVSWKTARKKPVLIAMTGYIIILIITSIYFVPELMELTGAPYNDSIDASLQFRGSRWITLSLIRAAILILLAVNLLLGLTKAETRIADAK